jgi:hypothetical protein
MRLHRSEGRTPRPSWICVAWRPSWSRPEASYIANGAMSAFIEPPTVARLLGGMYTGAF